MSDKMFGDAVIAMDGYELPTVPGSATMTPGLATAKPRKGPRGYIGSSVHINLGTLKVEVAASAGFDPATLAAGKEVTARFTDSVSSKEWVFPIMVMNEDPEMSDGEESKWSLSFEGSSAEAV